MSSLPCRPTKIAVTGARIGTVGCVQRSLGRALHDGWVSCRYQGEGASTQEKA